MRTFMAVAAIVLAMTLLVAAQEVPKVEIFGGYSLFHFDDKGLESELQAIDPTLTANRNLHGWNAAAQFNVNHWLGIVGDFSGHYGNVIESPVGSVSGNVYNFLFGPQINLRGKKMTGFVHGLFGANRSKINSIAVVPPTPEVTDTAFAMALGGGLDINASKRFAVRIAQFDYIYTTHTFSQYGLDLSHQNNFRFSAGIVLKLGEKQ